MSRLVWEGEMIMYEPDLYLQGYVVVSVCVWWCLIDCVHLSLSLSVHLFVCHCLATQVLITGYWMGGGDNEYPEG